MKNKIFISYRREDSIWSTGRIHDWLAKHFSKEQLFIDIDSIAPGIDFVSYIEESVNNCDVLLAVIGQKWIENIQSKANETDFVRLEIATALKNNIHVIPILVENTKMPLAKDLPDELKTLTRRNAFVINPSSVNKEMEALIKILHNYFLDLTTKNFRYKDEIISNLKQLITEGDIDNFLIISAGEAIVQFAAVKGEPTVWCETSSNENLPKRAKLNNDQIEKLIAMGFNMPDKQTSNLYMQFTLQKEADFEQLARIVWLVFFDVHKFPAIMNLIFKINLN